VADLEVALAARDARLAELAEAAKEMNDEHRREVVVRSE
jgi:hypothetical protein